MKRSSLSTMTLMAALLATSVAYAAPGQTSGSNRVTSTWGVNEGNSYASVDLSVRGAADFSHNTTAGSITVLGSSSPGVKLFSHKETVWDASAGAGAQRRSNGQNLTVGLAGLKIGGTQFGVCQLSQATAGTQCRLPVQSINKTFTEGEVDYWILGVIPVSVGGRINGNVTTVVHGEGSLSSFANTAASTSDYASAGVAVTGAVVGTAWVFVGLKGVLGVGGKASVTFMEGGVAPYMSATRNKCKLGGNCTANNRISYALATRADSSYYNTLGGKITVRGCLAACETDTVFSWKGEHLTPEDITPANRSASDSFSGTF